jgi:predicted SAM-dependent methyltransferase
MSFSDDFFDSIFCISVMEHMQSMNRTEAIMEMVRVLKPGGILIVTMDLRPDEPHAVDEIVRASGLLHLKGSLDHSISTHIRHGHTYDVAGLILEKR